MSTSELPSDQTEEEPYRALLMRHEPGVGVLLGVRMFEGEAWLHPRRGLRYNEKWERRLAIAACAMLGYTDEEIASKVDPLYGPLSGSGVRNAMQGMISTAFGTRCRDKWFDRGLHGDGPRIVVAHCIEPGTLASLEITERQWEALRLVAMGKTDEEGAQQLSISPRTFERELKNVRMQLPDDGDAQGRAGLGTLYHLSDPANLPAPPPATADGASE